VFDIDLARCLYCGLCEDACPADAIKLGQEYEISQTRSEDLVVHLEDLIIAPQKNREWWPCAAGKIGNRGRGAVGNGW